MSDSSAANNKPARLTSLDAYRGFVMIAMASSGLGLAHTARRLEGNAFWDWIGYEFSHVPWTGCSFWDLIQPSFMFIVGVAMPYSYAARRVRGDSKARTAAHVLYRAVVLVLLGIFLRSDGRAQTYFTFEDVLTQIGLGYAFIYLTVGRGLWVQGLAAAAILIGDWWLFFQHPLPGLDFDYASVGIPADWRNFTGLAAHWNKNTNAAAGFDVWFLNLFPRSNPFRYNGGGYQTLSFIPSMATMIFGIMVGTYLRGAASLPAKCKRLVIAGGACFVVAMAVDGTIWPFVDWRWSLCPVVKRIWTPSWVVFSTGWTLWLLAAFVWLIEIKGYRRWAFPFVVVGMNSIAMYVMAELMKTWVRATLETHLGKTWYDDLAGVYGPILEASATLLVLWLICLWMYRRKIFLRI